MPPGLKEDLKFLLTDRPDLCTPTLTRIAVNAGEQPASAPLLTPLGLEQPADRKSALTKRFERNLHGRRRQAGGLREFVHRDRTRNVEVAPNERGCRLVGGGCIDCCDEPGRKRVVRHEPRATEQRFDL